MIQLTNNPPALATKHDKAFLLAAAHFLSSWPQDMSAEELSNTILALEEDGPEVLEKQKKIIPWGMLVHDIHPMDDPYEFAHELIMGLAHDFVLFAEEYNK